MDRCYNNSRTFKPTNMRKILQRILAAYCVLFTKRVIVIDAQLDKKRNQMAVGFWTTVQSPDDQLLYLEEMVKQVKYDSQQRQKVRKFNPQSN